MIEKAQSNTGAGEVFETPFMRIVFQHGFPRDVGINGVRVQDVIKAAIARLSQFQRGPLACDENARAISWLTNAAIELDDREERRREQGVLNTMQPHEYVRTEDELDDFSATGG